MLRRNAARLPDPVRTCTLVLLGALAVTACKDPNSPRGAPALITSLPRQLGDVERRIIAGTSQFAFGLLREEVARNPGANVFISPLSASFALGMAANGSAGGTFDAMSRTLGFGGATQAAMAASYRSLLDLLRGLDPQVRLQIANSVWYRREFTVLPSFLDESRRFFDARIAALDFASPTAPTTINAWVSENTNGRIKTIVDGPIDTNLVMYLINAVYFKGSWREQFEVARTRQETFTKENGSRVSVAMMNRGGSARFYRGADFDAVDVGYGGDAFTMTILLPSAGRTARQLAATLDTAAWRAVREGLGTAQVDLAMPRYRMEFKDSLVGTLKALGMSEGFCDQPSDFSRISAPPPDLCISLVDQKTFVDVNEEGTEAAAVTSVGIGVTSAPERRVVRVDRPFIVVIGERISGTILFAGLVVDPPQER